MATVKEMVTSWLIDRGHEGLFNADADCACDLASLMACDEPSPDCEPGYKAPCPADCGEHSFHVQAARPRGGA